MQHWAGAGEPPAVSRAAWGGLGQRRWNLAGSDEKGGHGRTPRGPPEAAGGLANPEMEVDGRDGRGDPSVRRREREGREGRGCVCWINNRPKVRMS